jgi:hypothetical protein
MTGIQIFAFVILPIVVVVLGWMGVLTLEHEIRRSREVEKLHPGE